LIGQGCHAIGAGRGMEENLLGWASFHSAHPTFVEIFWPDFPTFFVQWPPHPATITLRLDRTGGLCPTCPGIACGPRLRLHRELLLPSLPCLAGGPGERTSILASLPGLRPCRLAARAQPDCATSLLCRRANAAHRQLHDRGRLTSLAHPASGDGPIAFEAGADDSSYAAPPGNSVLLDDGPFPLLAARLQWRSRGNLRCGRTGMPDLSHAADKAIGRRVSRPSSR
jgi:hypothetical protein